MHGESGTDCSRHLEWLWNVELTLLAVIGQEKQTTKYHQLPFGSSQQTTLIDRPRPFFLLHSLSPRSPIIKG